jgi:hypothetical protein
MFNVNRRFAKADKERRTSMFKNPMFEMNGYEEKTTFWSDFSIADAFGTKAIRDTFNRAFKEWKSDYIYLTELVMVMNHKIWQWYEKNPMYGKLYNDLWKIADEYACENLKGDELTYFYQTTD